MAKKSCVVRGGQASSLDNDASVGRHVVVVLLLLLRSSVVLEPARCVLAALTAVEDQASLRQASVLCPSTARPSSSPPPASQVPPPALCTTCTTYMCAPPVCLYI